MFSVTIYFGPFVSILVSCITLTGNTLPILTMSCCRNSASSRRKEREGAASTRDLKISFLSFAYWSTSLFNLIKSSFTFCCCVTPPWLLEHLHVNFDLHFFHKEHTPPDMFRSRFYELRSNYDSYHRIYTDGSKS